jgi:stage V sporulation protein S
MELLKVSAWSNPKSVAGAIAAVVRRRGWVDVQAIGMTALNRAIKAIAIARAFVAEDGIDLVCAPSFRPLDLDGVERTAIRFRVEGRAREAAEGAGGDARL